MKKTIITIIAVFTAAFSASAQEIIDFDFAKVIRPSCLQFDIDGNGKADDGEIIIANDSLTLGCIIRHKDFGSAGSINRVIVTVDAADESLSLRCTATLEDIQIISCEFDGDETICAIDGFGELIYTLAYNEAQFGWVLIIHNVAMFDIDY